VTAYVFVGPTLARDQIAADSAMVYLPPAAQGDVYRVAQTQPAAIGIIDGYFEGVPSIWHKEILWAMSQGIHVYGSASMGALRAAELHEFGMEGVGLIFEAYRDGILEDDDDVAVLHGPAESGYAAVSEPMVNIRFTLERAEQDRILGPQTRRRLEAIAKQQFYQERTWTALLDLAAQVLPEGELVSFRDWLPRGRIDQKRADALTMLDALRTRLATGPEPARASYTFEWTELWDKAMGFSGALASAPAQDGRTILRKRLLDDLRLDADEFESATKQALLRLLALREFERLRPEAPREQVKELVKRFRAERGLFDRRGLDRWLAENDSDLAWLEHALGEEAKLEALKAMARPLLDRHLLAGLRLSGAYRRLAERAARKESALAGLGLDDPEPGTVGPSPASLLAWYFEHRLQRSIPEDVEAVARRMGFANTGEFYRALLREFLYCSRSERIAEAGRPKQDG